jgi:hypothetical protein
MTRLFLFLILILLTEGCKKSDQILNNETWVLKSSNKSDYDVKIVFIKSNSQYMNKIFINDTLNNIELFRGSYGLLIDEITRKYYDSCNLIFNNKYVLKFYRNDTFQHNILKIDNFKATGEYQDGMKVLLYTITNTDFLRADTL